jgi:hypothetical protein
MLQLLQTNSRNGCRKKTGRQFTFHCALSQWSLRFFFRQKEKTRWPAQGQGRKHLPVEQVPACKDKSYWSCMFRRRFACPVTISQPEDGPQSRSNQLLERTVRLTREKIKLAGLMATVAPDNCPV